jgi:cytochrome c-type biogenesis protein CcmF
MAGIGQALLLLGAVAAGVAAVLAIARRGTRAGEQVAVGLLGLAAAALVAATLTLMLALVQHDFTLVYVADTSRRAMSAPYRAAATWGGMEGSLLFWTALLATVSALALARFVRRARAASPLVIAVPAALTAAFAVIGAATANPFRTLQVPATDGSGLVPILEHPAMLYHPPLLYLGLVALVPPFALTLGALSTGRLDAAWRQTCRRWMFVPWILLAVGMIGGANWAYVELGWGGYWAWDPIENTALLPWLAVTAFLHQSVRARGRDAAAHQEGLGAEGLAEESEPRADLIGAALVLLAFVVAILGTLLTRSGAASSVHAFGQATAVGRALLALVTVLAVICVVVLARAWRRARHSTPSPAHSDLASWLTRDGLLRVQLVLVVGALTLILAGTMSPILRSLLGGETTAVDGSYFATMTAPAVWCALLIMAIAPALGSPRSIEQILRVPALIGLAVAALVALAGWTSIVTLVSAALAGLAGSAAVIEGARRWNQPSAADGPGGRATGVTRVARLGPHVAHLGFAVLLLGIAGSTAAESATVLLATGQTATVAGVDVRNDGVRVDDPDGDEPKVVVALDVRRGGSSRRLEPAITGYRLLGQRLAETALWSEPGGDVQVALRDARDDGRVLVEVHTRPLAPLVWWGGLLLVAGGVLAATGSRSTRRPADRPDRPNPTELARTNRS